MSGTLNNLTAAIPQVAGDRLIMAQSDGFTHGVNPSEVAILASGATTARALGDIASVLAQSISFAGDPSATGPITKIYTVPELAYGVNNNQFSNYCAFAAQLNTNISTSYSYSIYNASLTSTTNTDAIGDVLYVTGNAGSGSIWGGNWNVQANTGAGSIGIIGLELDMLIENQDYPPTGSASCFGFFVNSNNITGHAGTAAYNLWNSGYPSAPSWYYGFCASGNVAKETAFISKTGALVAFQAAGTETVCFDASASTGNNGLRMNSSQFILLDQGQTGYVGAGTTAFGFNVQNKTVVLNNDGYTTLSINTAAGTPQFGLATVGQLLTSGYTVAALPTGSAAGTRAYVTDATAPTFLGTLTGGGSVVCPVFYNGTAWVAA